MELSIIVVNWNTRELLAQCLDSVYANPPWCAFEVWVVDNASSDGSAQMVRERFPQVHLMANSENVGFARANNQAIALSEGRFILLLNSDTIVQPNALSHMLAFMDAHAEAGIVGTQLLNADGSPQWCFGPFPSLMSESARAFGLNTRWPFAALWGARRCARGEYQATDWLLGAALMVRRAVLNDVGLLDANYFMYSEEVDLAYRVKRAGWQNFVLCDAPIIHLGQQSTSQIPAAMKAELFRSKLKYFRKFHGKTAAALLRLAFTSSIRLKHWSYNLRGQRDVARLWAATWQEFSASEPMRVNVLAAVNAEPRTPVNR